MHQVREFVGKLDEEQPAAAGGSLTSKPTWLNSFGCSATSAFLLLVRKDRQIRDELHRGKEVIVESIQLPPQ
jgi:hypothetical protein